MRGCEGVGRSMLAGLAVLSLLLLGTASSCGKPGETGASSSGKGAKGKPTRSKAEELKILDPAFQPFRLGFEEAAGFAFEEVGMGGAVGHGLYDIRARAEKNERNLSFDMKNRRNMTKIQG